ncbi:MAG: S8 family serine peptidase [Bacteroidales bacterium]|nr:S8 family serine peptidase [Bacteroidales bacterium]
MRRPVFICLLLITASGLLAQGNSIFKYWIEFSDKDDTPFSTEQPGEFLSERAIQRRLNQSIPISENDLPVDPAYVAEIEMIGGKTIHTSRWFNAMLYETADSLDLDQIRIKEFVTNVHAMYWGEFSYFSPPNETKKSTSDEYFDYGLGENQIHLHNGQRLHNEGFRGAGMIIAVLDGGFYYTDTLPAFDSLWANDQIILSKDFVHKGNNVFREHPHGMSVLSLMGGNIPGMLVGTAPEADYMLLRSEDVNTEWRVEEINWIAAAEFADSTGADVINTSLGYSLFNNEVQNYTTGDMDGNSTWVTRAADLAASKGILVVSSAGNSGDDPWTIITSPADGDSVLAVGAVDSAGVYASFSSQGPTADGRIKPNVMAQGSLAYVQRTDGTVNKGSGTSYAAPIMAGLATCLWQRFPEKTNYEIIKILEQSSSRYPYPNNKLGYGIPNMGVANDIITSSRLRPSIAENNIYPNPVEDKIHLKLPEKDGRTVNVEIFDVSGKLQQSIPVRTIEENYELVIHLNHQITTGMYFVRITTDNKAYTLRFIKK